MKLVKILFFCLVATACSHSIIEDSPLDETSRGGESICFLDKDSVFLSAAGDSAEIRSLKGYFFDLSYVYAFQGKDTTVYRWGDNGEYEVEDSTCLQVIEGSWYTIRTLSDKGAEEWGCAPILPIKINVRVAANHSGEERKLMLEVTQLNSLNRVYVIQPEK